MESITRAARARNIARLSPASALHARPAGKLQKHKETGWMEISVCRLAARAMTHTKSKLIGLGQPENMNHARHTKRHEVKHTKFVVFVSCDFVCVRGLLLLSRPNLMCFDLDNGV
jgi:hypothetical protein